MESSQLVYLLLALGKGELRELRKWLISPVHNQREDVVRLFDYLTEKERLSDEKKLAKAVIFKKLFPKDTYDDARLRQAVYFLQKCTEEYLAYREFQRDEIRSGLALAEVFRRKNLDRLLEKTLKKLQEDLENGPLKDESYLENQYRFQNIEYQYISEKKRSPDTNLQAYSDALDLRFIAGKLRIASLITAVQKVYKQDIFIGLLEETLNAVEEKELMRHPAIAVYYYVYKALSDNAREDYFFSLKETFFLYGHYFSLEEQRDLLLLAVNYCIAKMNTGAANFIGEAFDLYKRGIESGALLDKGVLNHLTFINIVITGATLRQFDWVRWFIQNFQQYLAPQYRENFVCYSLAKLHFEQREYAQAQKLLMQFDYDEILFNLSAKSMLIKIYYEEGEYGVLDSLLESLRTYINRKKAIAYHKNIYNNLIRFTKRLIRLSPYDKAQKAKLRQEIEAANPLPERKWLLEQLENL